MSSEQSWLADEMMLRQQQDAALNAIELEVNESPLVGEMEATTALLADYTNSELFTTKLINLSRIYPSFRRVRGDGNCFYRAYSFCCCLAAITDRQLLLSLIATLEPTLDLMCAVAVPGNEGASDRYILEDFYQPFIDTLTCIRDSDASTPAATATTTAWLCAQFNDTGTSASIVYYCRLLTAMQMRLHPDDFLPFIDEGDSLEQFLQLHVMLPQRDADMTQIVALTQVMKVTVCIQYLDLSDTGSSCNSHTFPEGGEAAVTLLYKPSHYDILC